MLRITLKIVFAFCLCFNNVSAQNLVPNGSFENYSICPDSWAKIYRATGWFQPHKYPGLNSVNQCSSSDYYNSCGGDSASFFVDVPSHTFGYQFAHSGNAYAGIAYYTHFYNGNGGREYIEVKLNQTLSANKKYNLKYYVSMCNGSPWSITRFDAHLSNDSLLHTSANLDKIPVIPQFEYYGRINDTLNWVEINGSYTAIGTEKFLTLGNFHNGIDSDTLTEIPLSTVTVGGAYYYIDDVSLSEDTILGMNETSEIDFSIYPNPGKNIVQINSNQIIQEVVVMDIQSKVILQLKPAPFKTTLDISQLEDGIYIVECKFKNGELLHKKIFVQR